MSGQEKNWGTEYRRHRRKGMDANDAAVRADQWLERQDRKWHDMGYETARFEAEVRMEARADKAESALQAALAREAGLREALEPFARQGRDLDEDDGEDRREMWDHHTAMDLTLGDLRKAASALNSDGSEVLAVMNAAWRLHGFDRLLKQFGPSHDGAVERDMATARDDLCKALDQLQEKRDG